MRTISVKYTLGHTIQFKYEQHDIYCPNCGVKEVWCEFGSGDFYEGPQHVCTACEYVFFLPRMSEAEGYALQVIQQLKEE